MDGMISMYVLLVCVWCSLDAGGILVVVTAEPTVSAVIITPEADRKEGGQVDMRCTAKNLVTGQIVEWRSTHPDKTLRWNDSTLTVITRFMFTTTYPQGGMVAQDFTITDLQIDDYGEYICNVKEPLERGGHVIVATSSVILSPPSYPICSPSGPITVDTGTELRMRCLSETDNPAVITGTHPMTDPSSYTWTSSSVDGTDTLSMNLNITVADDGVAFNCSVIQGRGADMKRSCIIGPIIVSMSTDGPTDDGTTVTTLPTDAPTPASNSAAIAGAVGGGVAALLIIILLILICRKRRLCHQTKKDPISKPSTNTKFTSDQPEHSQSSLFDRMDMQDQPASSPTKPSTSEPVVYDQPNKHQSAISTNSNAGGRYPENASDVTPHTNPAFDSMDLDGSTEPYAPVKPVAKVRPSKKPIKPQPYQPKSERQSSPPDITNDQMPQSPPTDTPSSLPTDQDESHPAPNNPMYAQVSRPKSNPDHIVYADLDLKSGEVQDGGPQPQSSSEGVTYASVNMY